MEKLITDFSLGLFFWHTLLFIILVIFLKKFAWKPILASIEEREEGIKQAIDSAERAKEEMKSLNADNERILKEAKQQRDSLLKEARELKEKIINEAKNEAVKEANNTLSLAKEQIQNEKSKALESLKSTVSGLSIDIAESILKKELSNKKEQEALVNSLIEKTDFSK